MLRIDLTACLACILGLTACGTPSPASPTPVPTAEVFTPALAVAPTPASPSVPFGQSVLVAQFDPTVNSIVLAPVDPSTGIPLAGHAAVALGASFDYGFTPDGHTLIFTKYASSNPARGELHFLDLATWKDDFALLLLSANWTSALAFSQDGARLAIATAGPNGSSLWLVDSRRRVVLAHIQTQALVSEMKFSSDGQSLMDYEHPGPDNAGPSELPPDVVLRSTSDLSAEWSRSLTVVRDGFVPNETFAGDPYQPGVGSMFRPAIVFAPDKDLLYVVHADVLRLTRIDFDRKSVLTLDIRPELSWIGRILVLSATTAFAKPQNGIELQASISPDGTTIYVDGVKTTLTKQTSGQWLEEQAPLNLQAIRLKDAVQIYKSTAAGGTLELSADGASLLVPQMDDSTGTVTGTSEVDPLTGSPVGQYAGLALRFAALMDGTPILVSAFPGATNPQTTRMTALTPGHQLLGSWTTPGCAEWLFKP